MYTNSRLTYLCDFGCWIPTSAVHRFQWDNSCFESCRHCDLWILKLINDFCGQSLFDCYDDPGMGIKPRFGTQKKCPFPLNRGVPLLEVTNTMIMRTFSGTKVLCPLNGRYTWIEVSQEEVRLYSTKDPHTPSPPPPPSPKTLFSDTFLWRPNKGVFPVGSRLRLT